MYLLEKNFENATIEDIEELRRYFEAGGYQSSGHTFSSMYMWGPEYYTSWEKINGYLWTVSSYLDELNEKNYYTTMPLSLKGYGDIEGLAQSIKHMKELFASKGKKLVMFQVPEKFVPIIQRAWQGPLKVEKDPDSFDYVYDKNKLINLSGRKLHKKKNHLNYFMNNYEYSFENLQEEDVKEAIQFVEEFNRQKETDTVFDAMVLKRETEAIKRALDLDLKGRPDYITKVIRIDGKIQALAIGALIDSKEAAEHIEKANPTIRGLYQAINQEFAKSLPSSIQIVNREEDMGIPNLRQAKEGYQPAFMYEKSTVVVL